MDKKLDFSLEDNLYLSYKFKDTQGNRLPIKLEVVSKRLPPMEELIEGAGKDLSISK